MLALYRSGRQAEALEAYQQARSTLVEELGIEPTPALQELERRILTQDRSLELAPAAVERITAPERPSPPDRSILVVGTDRAELRDLLPLAELLAGAKDPHEVLAALLLVAGDGAQDLLGDTAGELETERAALLERGVFARVAAFTSTDAGEDVTRLAMRPEVDLLLLAGDRQLLVDGQFSPHAKRVLAEAPSHIGLWVKPRGLDTDQRISAVAVPLGGAEHDWAAVEIAAWAASSRGIELHLLGSTADSQAGRRDASRLLADAAFLIQRTSDVVPKAVLVRPGREGIADAAKDVDLLVVGFSEQWSREGLGMLRWSLATTSPVPILFVRRGLRPSGLAPGETSTRFTWSVTELGGS
jgi:hypothetical protein